MWFAAHGTSCLEERRISQNIKPESINCSDVVPVSGVDSGVDREAVVIPGFGATTVTSANTTESVMNVLLSVPMRHIVAGPLFLSSRGVASKPCDLQSCREYANIELVEKESGNLCIDVEV